MKKVFFLTLSMFAFFALVAQENNWQPAYSGNGVEFYSKKTECHDVQNGIHEEYFLIQIHNTTQTTLTLNWNFHYYNNDLCTNCKEDRGDVKTYSVRLQPGETLEGTCENKSNKGLQIFSRFLNYKTTNPVTRFTVENVNVKFD